jgi:hypothetical protein
MSVIFDIFFLAAENTETVKIRLFPAVFVGHKK